MNEPALDYDVLGPAFDEVVAGSQHARQADLARVRANLLTPPPPRDARRPWGWVLLAPIAAAAALLLGWQWLLTPQLQYTVDGRSQPADMWIFADQRDAHLEFSDGSEAIFHRGTRGRVTRVDRDDARLLVEQGHVSIEAAQSEQTQWTVSAGPYVLRGDMAFLELSWSLELALLRVEVRRGEVELTGPSLEPAQVLREGEILELTRGEVVIRRSLETPARVEPPTEQAHSSAPEPAVLPDDEVSPPVPARPRPHRRGSSSSRTRPAAETWRDAAAREDYAASFDMVAPRLESLYGSLGRADLLRLADVARFSGHPDHAIEALTRFRQRFPRHRDAATAAYTLGHVLAAQGSSAELQQAVRWFTTAIGERPRGPLHRSALARLIKSHQRLGQHEAARAVAKTYLERYPQGPHAKLARRAISP